MSKSDHIIQLSDYLRERGHTEAEIEKIMSRVQKYDSDAELYSLMDSIGTGSVIIENFIAETLAE